MPILWLCKLILVTAGAVALVAAPALAQYRVYWGDTHGHTGLSDGKVSLDEYLTYARDVAKLDFVIVSDHDFGNSTPWRMPKEDWQLTQRKVAEYTVPGRFVAIAGYEWTSQRQYWTELGSGVPSERLFPGPPKLYNHKNVYFPFPVEYLFSAKDVAYQTPELLAEAVRGAGGLIQNNHPDDGPDSKDQFAYGPRCYPVIANTEMGADTLRYGGKIYTLHTERVVRDFLNRGGRTGFVKGTDTHEGKPAARTAVLARSLTREAIFEALRQRRNYAVSNARIGLDFRVDGHRMGEEVEVEGPPRIMADVRGASEIAKIEIIRDGEVLFALSPGATRARLTHVDHTFRGSSYYYLRVTQADVDENGNPSCAWSSPIWVHAEARGVQQG